MSNRKCLMSCDPANPKQQSRVGDAEAETKDDARLPGAEAPVVRGGKKAEAADDRIDTRLMRRVKFNDDPAAFAALLRRIRRAIDGPLRSLPPDQIEDGRSEVTLRLWKFRRQFRQDKGTVRAWVAGIARNYTRAWWRRKAHGADLDSGEGNLADTRHPDPAAAAEQADWTAYVRRRCAEVLLAFPPYVQASWRLRVEQGLSFREVARLVGRPVGSVASALFRVRNRVLARFQDNKDPATLHHHGVDVMSNNSTASSTNEINDIKDRQTTLEQKQRVCDERLDGHEKAIRELSGLALADQLTAPLAALEELAAGMVHEVGVAELMVRLVRFEETWEALKLKDRLPRLLKALWGFVDQTRKRKAFDAVVARHLIETRKVLANAIAKLQRS